MKHGHSTKARRTPEYCTWSRMLGRCRNPKDHAYPRYGGKGVKVCERWLEFANFLADMGQRPTGKTLDRIDTDGNYCLENCRWATAKEQANNTSAARQLEYKGETDTLANWAAKLQINPRTIKARLRKGWTVEKALSRFYSIWKPSP